MGDAIHLKPPRTFNFLVWQITISKRMYSGITKKSLFQVSISKRLKLQRVEDSDVLKIRTFKIKKYDWGGSQPIPNITQYPEEILGNSHLKDGTTLSSVKNPRIIKGVFETKLNDNGGDSHYEFEIGDLKVSTNNRNRSINLNSEKLGPQTTIEGGLVSQSAGNGGFYDSCDGYKIKLRVQFHVTKKRLRFVPIVRSKD